MTIRAPEGCVNIAQITDLHLPAWEGFGWRDALNKRVTGWVNHRLSRHGAHDPHLIQRAVDALVEIRPDLTLITGDVTNVSLASEFRRVASALEPLVKAGLPTAYIPGNHDLYVPDALDGRVENLLNAHLHADVRPGPTFPYVKRVGQVSVLLLNSAHPAPPLFAWGRLDDAQLASTASLLAAERAEGQGLMVALHHHPTAAPHRRVDFHRGLRGGRRLLDLCAAHQVQLVVHGHNHRHELRWWEGDQGQRVLICGLGSTSLRLDQRAEIGFSTWTGPSLSALRFARWDDRADAFTPALSLTPGEVTRVLRG